VASAEEDKRRNDESFLSTLDQLRQKKDEAVGALQQVAALLKTPAPGELPAAAAAGNKTSGETLLDGFNLSRNESRSMAEDYASSPARGFVREAVAVSVPFAQVPFAVLDHVFATVSDTADRTLFAIQNFEKIDPHYLDQTLEGFGSRAFPPSVLLGAALEPAFSQGEQEIRNSEFVRGSIRQVTEPVARAVPRVVLGVSMDEPSRIAARQWVQTSAAGTGAPGGTAIYSGWEGASYEIRKTVNLDFERDSKGTPLLFDRNGNPFGYDAARNQVEYSVAESRSLAEQRNLAPRLKWERQRANDPDAGFLPIADSQEMLRDRMEGWFMDPLIEEYRRTLTKAVESVDTLAPR
jgi:hypothetical protein